MQRRCRRLPRVVPLVLSALACGLSACASRPELAEEARPLQYLSGHNYSYAIYNQQNLLIHSPIEHLMREQERRAADRGRQISDVYVLSHGWNYTIEESAALYENYRLSLSHAVERFQQTDPDFEPYFIFVAWGSVTRPLSEAVNSISPFQLPRGLDEALEATDNVVFHLFSNWGETQDAFRMALGQKRLDPFEPQRYPDATRPSYYRSVMDRRRRDVLTTEFNGEDIPLTLILDELMRQRLDTAGDEPAFRLHVVGHSFGAKVASLATLDACARMLAAGYGGSGSDVEYVDSLILVNAAMKEPEMYYAREIEGEARREADVAGEGTFSRRMVRFEPVADAVGRKVLAYTYHDSANGWLFALSQYVLSYDAIAESDVNAPFPRDWYGFGWINYIYSAGYAVLVTALKDVEALTLGPINWVRRFDTWDEFPGRVATLPLSPILVQRSIGAAGFKGVETYRSPAISDKVSLRPKSWLTSDAVSFLRKSKDHPPEALKDLSDAPGAPLVGFDPTRFNTYDASDVYNGYVSGWMGPILGSIANQLLPGTAHGDIRSYSELPSDDAVEGERVPLKRDRTMTWIFNVTRGALPEPEPDGDTRN